MIFWGLPLDPGKSKATMGYLSGLILQSATNGQNGNTKDSGGTAAGQLSGCVAQEDANQNFLLTGSYTRGRLDYKSRTRWRISRPVL
jgi:hypothetical protein